MDEKELLGQVEKVIAKTGKQKAVKLNKFVQYLFELKASREKASYAKVALNIYPEKRKNGESLAHFGFRMENSLGKMRREINKRIFNSYLRFSFFIKLNKDQSYEILDDPSTIHDAWIEDIDRKEGKNKDNLKEKIENQWKIYCNRTEEDKLRTDIIDFLNNVISYLNRFKAFHSHDEVPLKDLYTPIQVTSNKVYNRNIESFFDYYTSDFDLKKAYSFKGINFQVVNPIPWDQAKKEAFEEFNNIMILADPGMGKTALLKIEAINYAISQLDFLKKNNNAKNELVLPIYIKLSNIDINSNSMFKAIINTIIHEYEISSDPIKDFLETKLSEGKIILFLDGLDEVRNPNYSVLLDKFKLFFRKYPCKSICASRIIGYISSIFPKSVEYEIVPFSKNQSVEFVRSWFNNFKSTRSVLNLSANDLIENIYPHHRLAGLTQIPLLLSLICSLYTEKDFKLPSKKALIYEEAIQYMLTKWPLERKKRYSKKTIAAKINLLNSTAYFFSSNNKDIFEYSELFNKEYITLTEEASELMNELIEDDGFFVAIDRNDTRYIFIHKTFQEYLSACYLKNIFKKDSEEGLKILDQYYWNFFWHEIIPTLAEIMDNPFSLIEAISKKKDDIFYSLLKLSGKCISECHILNYPLITFIIKKIYRLWLVYPHSINIKYIIAALTSKYTFMYNLLIRALKDNSNNIIDAIDILIEIRAYETTSIFINMLRHNDDAIKRLAIMALGSIGNKEATIELINFIKRTDDNELIKTAIIELSKINNTESKAALYSFLKSNNIELRILAALNIKDNDGYQVTLTSIDIIKKQDKIYKYKILPALARFQNPISDNFLMQLLNNSDGYISNFAAIVLGNICDHSKMKLFLNDLHGKNVKQKKVSMKVLAYSRYPDATPVFINLLKNDDIYFKDMAIWALGQRRNYEAIPELINIIEQDDPELKQSAISTLSKICDPKTINILIEALDYEVYDSKYFFKNMDEMKNLYLFDPFLYEGVINSHKIEIIRALGNIQNPKAIPILDKYANSEYDLLKIEAIYALGKIGNNKTISIFKRILKDNSFQIRNVAIRTLDKIKTNESIELIMSAILNEKEDVEGLVETLREAFSNINIVELILKSPQLNVLNRTIYYNLEKFVFRNNYIGGNEKHSFFPIYPSLIRKYKSLKAVSKLDDFLREIELGASTFKIVDL